MKRIIKALLISIIALGLLTSLIFFFNKQIDNINNNTTTETIDKNGTYTSKEDVALYIHIYKQLPSNYINKKEAKKLGWISSEGNLQQVCTDCSIGGDVFGNREKLLPEKQGRKYYECDIDYKGGNRNAKRIIYSNDGLIYYTQDHYKTFELLYGEP